MASLLLPELGRVGGLSLLTNSKNCAGCTNCGTTSASFRNLKKQIIGSFFSNIFISSHKKERFML